MGQKDLTKDVLNVVKKKTGKSVSEKAVQKLAKNVNSSTVKNEAMLRQLINQVSSLVNVPVSEQTTREIIDAVKKSNVNVNNLEQLIKMVKNK